MQVALLRPDLVAFVHEAVDSGRFESAEDIVAIALTQFCQRELREAIARGIEQADRGEVLPWDMNEIRQESERRIAASRAADDLK
jgi:Arc/MetJ-type ribon-helix-helix transcriptional regulator